MAVPSVSARLARLNWKALEAELWNQGHAVTEPVLTSAECEELVSLYPKEEFFRKTIRMGPRRFGEGDYKYFKYPLPSVVQSLRVHLYRRLAPIANRWMEALGERERYPLTLREFVDRCHRHGQERPTPLLLHYEAGGYNCLHQDLYGPLAFPLQVTGFLSRPGEDYGSGAFLLYELRPRAQSMCDALVPEQGALVIFATRMRPERGKRGYRRVQLKHGVGRVRSGSRYTLGIIFHDAK
ncbi:MAG TPA: 2OG-Fe(II) oxygenase [Myxococcaceae bacterium]|nr:2OG-Fe(II) oxygenase [Myxococcaceae bacterium]